MSPRRLDDEHLSALDLELGQGNNLLVQLRDLRRMVRQALRGMTPPRYDKAHVSAATLVTETSDTAVDVPDLSVTVTLNVNGRVRLEANLQPTAVDTTIAKFQFYEGDTALDYDRSVTQSPDLTYTNVTLLYTLDAAVGAHTYTVRWARVGGVGTMRVQNRMMSAVVIAD